ncbi:hypothetical protein E2320_014597, partial [Naja naja]
MGCQVLLILFLLMSHFPSGILKTGCPLNVVREEKYNYYKPGDYLISGILSTINTLFRPYVFDMPPTNRFRSTVTTLGLIIQIMDRREKLAIGKVWIVTSLSDLGVRWLYKLVDLQHKHAFLSFVIKRKRGTSYNPAASDLFAFEMIAQSMFQCSYSSSGLSRKVWKRCTEKETWEIPSPDIIARILSQDAY